MLYGLFEYTLLELVVYVAIKVLVFELEITTIAILISMAGVLMFWLFQLGRLIGWKYKFWNKTRRSARVKRRTGLRQQRIQRSRRKRLPFHLVQRCYDRPFNSPPEIKWKNQNCFVTLRYTPQDCQHRRWRRRQRKSKCRAWKRRVLNHEKFLLPKKSSKDL